MFSLGDLVALGIFVGLVLLFAYVQAHEQARLELRVLRVMVRRGGSFRVLELAEELIASPYSVYYVLRGLERDGKVRSGKADPHWSLDGRPCRIYALTPAGREAAPK